jgi:predicted aminopeptidase
VRLLPLLLLLCAGCVTVQAAAQSAEGELQLLASRKPIDEVVQNTATPAHVRKLLAQIPKIKKFGEANGLTATESYEDYVQLHRPAVVWVVTACQPLRFEAKTWSFPIAGSFPYLGWFVQASATGYAKDLEQDGWDADVRGASAYSTLGWFHDPVLSTMIAHGPEALGDLVDVVLHESVHATLHIDGQAPFNESLASFVADRLTPRYLDGASPFERNAWLARQEQWRHVSDELHEAYLKLDGIYRSPIPDDQKRAQKEAVLTQLRERLQWKRRLNNATLMGHRTYEVGAKGFGALLASCKDDFRCFFDRLRTLQPKSFAKQQDEEFDPVLERLASGGS